MPHADRWTFQAEPFRYERDPRIPADAEVLTALPGPESFGDSWQPVDLGPALRGEDRPAVPTLLRCDGGQALLYPACINGVHGDSGSGKGWLAAITAAQELQAGRHVVWVDFEDSPVVIVERLHQVLGVPADVLVWQLHYFRPVEPFDREAVAAIASVIHANRVSLVVIDSLGEAFGLEGIDEDRDAQVGPWLRRVARTLADLGPAVLLIDHSTKAKDNPLFPSGSKRKRAAITGAAYFLDAVKPLTREHGGRLRLVCAKDRHGHHRRGDPAAVIDFHVYPDGGTSVKVWPPGVGEPRTATPNDRLEEAARAVVKLVQSENRPMSGREIVERKPVRARAEMLRAAIDHAVGVGALRPDRGRGNTILHTYVPGGEALIGSDSDRVPSDSDALSPDRDPSASRASRPIGTHHSDAVAVAGEEPEPTDDRDALPVVAS